MTTDLMKPFYLRYLLIFFISAPKAQAFVDQLQFNGRKDMAHFMLNVVVLIFTICLVTIIQVETGCFGVLYSDYINLRLTCGIFKTLALNSVDCHKMCSITLNCFSVNTYQSNNGTEICELARGTNNSFEDERCLVLKNGSKYSELVVC